MMRTFVPHAAADRAPAGWGVRRADRLAFPRPAALAADPVHTERLRTYLTDLLYPYGLALDEAVLARGGQSYAEMGEALIARAVPPGESVDLLVLAYAVPDIAPGRATTTRLSHVCPGAPMAFAVTDQGATAPFTALRLIRAYACAAGMSRALLLIAEQPSVPYDAGLPRTLPPTATAVSLLLGPDSPFPLSLPAPGGTPSAVGAAIAATPGPVTAILGPGLTPAAAPGAHRVRTAAPGRPTTGVWWELAAEVASMQAAPTAALVRGGVGVPVASGVPWDPSAAAPASGASGAAAPPHLLVADRDPASGTLSLAALTPALQPAAPGRPI